MITNVISLTERKDYYNATNLLFAISKLDGDLALYNTKPSDLHNIGSEFLSLKYVSEQSLADYMGHTLSEVSGWLKGAYDPQEPRRTAIIIGIDIHVRQIYHIPRH